MVIKLACRSAKIVGSAMITADPSIDAINTPMVVTESAIHS